MVCSKMSHHVSLLGTFVLAFWALLLWIMSLCMPSKFRVNTLYVCGCEIALNLLEVKDKRAALLTLETLNWIY